MTSDPVSGVVADTLYSISNCDGVYELASWDTRHDVMDATSDEAYDAACDAAADMAADMAFDYE